MAGGALVDCGRIARALLGAAGQARGSVAGGPAQARAPGRAGTPRGITAGRVSRRVWLLVAALSGSLLLPAQARAGAVAASVPSASGPVLLVLGDSLSAEYGLARGTGWVALLGQRMAQQAPGWQVVNASISGDTTAGGRTRLGPLLAQHHPRAVVIELGGNDALRGLPLAASRDNLDAMVAAAQAAGARVMIAGIQVPPNFGRSYTQEFAGMFAGVAKARKTALLPFLLAGVADRPDADDWFQADRIHPLAKAHPLILDQVWPVLAPLLKR